MDLLTPSSPEGGLLFSLGKVANAKPLVSRLMPIPHEDSTQISINSYLYQQGIISV